MTERISPTPRSGLLGSKNGSKSIFFWVSFIVTMCFVSSSRLITAYVFPSASSSHSENRRYISQSQLNSKISIFKGSSFLPISSSMRNKVPLHNFEHFNKNVFQANANSGEETTTGPNDSNDTLTSSSTKVIPRNLKKKNPILTILKDLPVFFLLMHGSVFKPFSALSWKIATFVHFIALSVFFGQNFYTTVSVGPVSFKTLPRRCFGVLQSKLFPIYFTMQLITTKLMILTSTCFPTLSPQYLNAALVLSYLNRRFLEPKSTDIMFSRYDLEDAGKKDIAEYKNLGKEFGKIHGTSAMLNLISLILMGFHVYKLVTSIGMGSPFVMEAFTNTGAGAKLIAKRLVASIILLIS